MKNGCGTNGSNIFAAKLRPNGRGKKGARHPKCVNIGIFECELLGVVFQKYASFPGGEHNFAKKVMKNNEKYENRLQSACENASYAKQSLPKL